MNDASFEQQKEVDLRSCGTALVVPNPTAARPKAPPVPEQTPAAPPSPAVAAAPEPSPARQTLPVRIRRLTADAERMQTVFQRSRLIRVVSASGNPPDRYKIEYHIRSLARGKNGKPIPREQHLVEIQLTRDYPRQSPKCQMLTPIFHPNIEPAAICVGDHWTAAERLTDLVIRIGEMIAYQAYNIKSPLDGEAAMWADLNRDRLPIDSRDIHPREAH